MKQQEDLKKMIEKHFYRQIWAGLVRHSYRFGIYPIRKFANFCKKLICKILFGSLTKRKNKIMQTLMLLNFAFVSILLKIETPLLNEINFI